MIQDTHFETIPTASLLATVSGLHRAGYRLVQIAATRFPEQLELTYSFDLDGTLRNLRLQLPAKAAQVPSITPVYWGAFLYENEIHDLFEVQVEGIAVDFRGTLYKTAIKFPFGTTKAPSLKPERPPPKPSVPCATTIPPAPLQ